MLYEVITLHSAIDEVRTTIMPFNETFPLEDLKEALQYWYSRTNRKVSYEYVVWKGINDTQKDIDAFVKFCKYVPCKVNIIEYNPIDDGEFQQASSEALEQYIYHLEKNRIVVNVRSVITSYSIHYTKLYEMNLETFIKKCQNLIT